MTSTRSGMRPWTSTITLGAPATPRTARARAPAAAPRRGSRAVGARRPGFEGRGWDHVDLGIGINTGRMVVGNFGSRRRLEYAVVGDPVNVAARPAGPTQPHRGTLGA